VYRLDAGGFRLLTPSPIPSSRAVEGYIDTDGGIGAVYRLAAIQPDGSRMQSETFAADFIDNIERVSGRSVQELTTNPNENGVISEQRLILPQELQEIAKQGRSSNLAAQRELASQPGVKIGIKREGMYRVTRAQLQAAGFNVASDPTKWQLYLNGIERTINVDAGGNFIEFYGRGIDTNESDVAQYYLIEGATNGKRMYRRIARPINGPVTANNYEQSFFFKQRTAYIWDILNGETENWWGAIFTTAGVTIPLNITGMDFASMKSNVSISFHGFNSNAHTVLVELNGQSVGTVTGSGIAPFSGDFLLPTSRLIDGANTLTLKTQAAGDLVMFDKINIGFKRKHAADQNRVNFYTLGNRRAVISGFTSNNVRLFDITNESEVGMVEGLNVVANGPTFDVNLPAYRSRVYSALEDSAMLSPFSIKINNASSLATTARNGRLTIITHPDLMVQAEAWATYRRGQGVAVEVVDVEDVYDEFSFGQPTAASVTAFLNYARQNWQTPPLYVMLLGDGSYDGKNYANRGFQNMVPTKIVDTVYLETGSDEALADFNGDGLSEIAIGRIPVSTPAQAAEQLARVQAFEVPAQQNINRGVLFAYDDPNGFDFQWMSQQLRNQLPGTVPVTYVGLSDPNSGQVLINEMNLGKYLVNYAGHGTTGRWTNSSNFFGVNNLNGTAGQPQMANPGNRTIFTALTCLNGYFMNPYADSLSEYLVKYNNGGAILVWASTGLTTPDVQLIMATRFFQQLGNNNSVTRFGDLVVDAKSTIAGGTDVRLSWALMGDPMLKVKP
ncbi:MAG TPA: C25 family cysteine peptidase, partial [Pyrinomonadaceae bacterium]|nr:C25 family cysteine peptidase [Pyrinomonadaceae bacterium]